MCIERILADCLGAAERNLKFNLVIAKSKPNQPNGTALHDIIAASTARLHDIVSEETMIDISSDDESRPSKSKRQAETSANVRLNGSDDDDEDLRSVFQFLRSPQRDSSSNIKKGDETIPTPAKTPTKRSAPPPMDSRKRRTPNPTSAPSHSARVHTLSPSPLGASRTSTGSSTTTPSQSSASQPRSGRSTRSSQKRQGKSFVMRPSGAARLFSAPRSHREAYLYDDSSSDGSVDN